MTVRIWFWKVALSLRDRKRGRGDRSLSLGTPARQIAAWFIALPVAERQGYLRPRTRSVRVNHHTTTTAIPRTILRLRAHGNGAIEANETEQQHEAEAADSGEDRQTEPVAEDDSRLFPEPAPAE